MEATKPSSGSGGCGIEDGFGDDRSGRNSSLPQFKITDSSPEMEEKRTAVGVGRSGIEGSLDDDDRVDHDCMPRFKIIESPSGEEKLAEKVKNWMFQSEASRRNSEDGEKRSVNREQKLMSVR